MSKLTQPSVSDSFTFASNSPRNPNEPNWKQMLFQLALVIAGSVTFGLIMHYSNKKIIKGIASKIDSENQLAASNPVKIQTQFTSPVIQVKSAAPTIEAEQDKTT